MPETVYRFADTAGRPLHLDHEDSVIYCWCGYIAERHVETVLSEGEPLFKRQPDGSWARLSRDEALKARLRAAREEIAAIGDVGPRNRKSAPEPGPEPAAAALAQPAFWEMAPEPEPEEGDEDAEG